MPQIMVEAFARSLIDKIMLEAFDTVDTNEEKLEMLNNRQESTSIQSQSARTALQIQDSSCMDHNESETTELIEKMVHGLRNLQIGDSTSVPYHLSKLEKQVKHVVCNIDNVSPSDATKLAETCITQGQGDVHQIIHDAVIETTPARSHLEKETDSSTEATRVSVSLLHRMIEELETNAIKSTGSVENNPEAISKEKIAAWEETEEKLIRTIEGVDEPEQSAIANSQPENAFVNSACDFANEEITSSTVVHSTPFSRTTCLEELTIEEITPSPLPDQIEDGSPNVTSSKTKMKSRDEQSEVQKKKGVLSRTRKLFRTIFGRRKK